MVRSSYDPSVLDTMKGRASSVTFSAALLIALFGVSSDASEWLTRDNEVLNAVFVDLLENSSDDFEARERILFNPVADERPLTSNSILTPAGDFEEWWEQLTTDQRRLTKEAVAKLVSRIGANDLIRGFDPRDDRIQLFAKKEISSYGMRSPFQAWPPGYSEDGTIAVVILSFGWGSFHGASSTHVLLGHDEEWRVLVRGFTFYP